MRFLRLAFNCMKCLKKSGDELLWCRMFQHFRHVIEISFLLKSAMIDDVGWHWKLIIHNLNSRIFASFSISHLSTIGSTESCRCLKIWILSRTGAHGQPGQPWTNGWMVGLPSHMMDWPYPIEDQSWSARLNFDPTTGNVCVATILWMSDP